MEEVYEWEFEDIKPQLEEWYKKGIIDDENTMLYAWVGGVKSSVSNFQDFISLSIDDLALIGRAGTRFQGLLKGQKLTPEILAALREKLQAEVITELAKK